MPGVLATYLLRWPAPAVALQAAIALVERNVAAMDLPPEFTIDAIELQVRPACVFGNRCA